MPCGQKPEHKQQKVYCNKFNKDFKNGPCQKKKYSIRTLWLSKAGLVALDLIKATLR